MRCRASLRRHISTAMSWKPFVLQSVVLALLLFGVGRHLLVHEHSGLSAEQRRLSDEVVRLNLRLDQLERQVGRISTDAALILALPPAAQRPAGSEQALAALAERVAAMEARAKAIEHNAAVLRTDQAALVKQAQPEAVRVRNWMASLDAAKREAVEAAYREQLDEMQKAVSAAPDAPAPSPEAMEAVLQASREALKRRLRELLDDAEYQTFLDSLEETELPAGPPPLSMD